MILLFKFLIVWFILCLASSVLTVFTFSLCEFNQWIVYRKFYRRNFEFKDIIFMIFNLILCFPIMPFELLTITYRHFELLYNSSKFGKMHIFDKICMCIYFCIYYLILGCTFCVTLNTLFGLSVPLCILICSLLQVFFKLEYIFYCFTTSRVKLLLNFLLWGFYVFAFILIFFS